MIVKVVGVSVAHAIKKIEKIGQGTSHGCTIASVSLHARCLIVLKFLMP